MVGLLVLFIVLAFGAISFALGVDSREGFLDPRGPAVPIGLH